MTGAMYSAVAGLRAHMNALNVIGNNISNVNTNAYKASRYTFLESMYTNMRNGSDGTIVAGGKNPAQNGYGASIGTIDLDMSTKNFTPTGINGDCMINGNGFFIVGDKNNVITSNGDLKEMLLTRHGDLAFDRGGYLVDGNGKVVYGYLATERMVNKGTKDDPKWTTEYDGQPILTAIRMPMLVTKECYTYLNPKTGKQTVWAEMPKFDDFKTVAEPIYYDDTGKEIELTEEDMKNLIIKKEVGDCLYPSYENQGTDTDLDIQFVDCDEGEFVGDARALVDSISIDEKSGRVTATTTNGKIVVCGYIAIAKVENPNGVSHIDGHYYQALDGAGDVYATSIGHSVQNSHGPELDDNGDPIPGTASIGWFATDDQDGSPVNGEYGNILSSGATTLITGGLESSGTDLATEISNMILVQRGYQANTRIVTVTDSMLEELVNMKR